MSTLPQYIQKDIPGTRLTTMKVGGQVAFLARPTTLDQLQESLVFARQQNLPYKVLGAGSNLLIADAGLEGVVIQPHFTQIEIKDSGKLPAPLVEPRYNVIEKPGMLNLTASTVLETEERLWLEMGAGVPWGKAVMDSLQQQLGGLHWFARIPCSVGGAVYNNIHAESHFLSEFVASVEALDPKTNKFHTYAAEQLEFGYDQSLFHRLPHIICSATFALQKISTEMATLARAQYLEWTRQKSMVQPAGANSGSVFKNISLAQAKAIQQAAVAAAWYIDECGLKEKQVGGMQVYSGHANFIVNKGEGTQADFMHLVAEIRQAVYQRFKIVLEPEVECIDIHGNALQWPAIPNAPY